jgi:hypothetical protein
MTPLDPRTQSGGAPFSFDAREAFVIVLPVVVATSGESDPGLATAPESARRRPPQLVRQ